MPVVGAAVEVVRGEPLVVGLHVGERVGAEHLPVVREPFGHPTGKRPVLHLAVGHAGRDAADGGVGPNPSRRQRIVEVDLRVLVEAVGRDAVQADAQIVPELDAVTEAVLVGVGSPILVALDGVVALGTGHFEGVLPLVRIGIAGVLDHHQQVLGVPLGARGAVRPVAVVEDAPCGPHRLAAVAGRVPHESHPGAEVVVVPAGAVVVEREEGRIEPASRAHDPVPDEDLGHRFLEQVLVPDALLQVVPQTEVQREPGVHDPGVADVDGVLRVLEIVVAGQQPLPEPVRVGGGIVRVVRRVGGEPPLFGDADVVRLPVNER